MAKAYSDFDSESYPWDSVWEYILDDRNFEDLPAREKRSKKPWSSATQRQYRVDEGYDSDSAYEEEDAHRRAKQPNPALKPGKPILHQSKKETVTVENAKPKRINRFSRLLKKRLRRKKKSDDSTQVVELPREKHKVRFRDEEPEQEELPGYRSDFGLSRVPSFLQRQNDRTDRTNRIERAEDASVSENHSVSSETSSVLRLLQWVQPAKEVPKNDFENLSDDDLSDELSVMESIFQFEEARSDFDIDDRNRYRAKQKWRISNRRTSQQPELRRSFSDLFETRDTDSVQSSQSRRSRNSRLAADDSSVNLLMETQGGYLVHVPKSIAFAPTRFRRRTSFRGY